MIRSTYSKPTIEEAFQLAEAQARLREHNAQLHRDYMARRRAERDARKEARAQVKAQARAHAQTQREAARRLHAVVQEQERHEREELKRQRRALRAADYQLRGGKGVSMHFPSEQCAQLEEMAAALHLSQSEIIRRAVDAVYANYKRSQANV